MLRTSRVDELETLLAPFMNLPEDEQEAMYQEALAVLGNPVWKSNPGPQTEAYYSLADILLYGGQGGGGKTDLLTGLALVEHKKTLLMRPQYTDLGAIIDRVCGVFGGTDGLNASPPAKFRFGKGRQIDFGAANSLERAETWQGNPHDLIGFDEACQFLESVVRFVLGWNRSADSELGGVSAQRVRAVLASNPPLDSKGEWIIGMFRPWLDLTHPDYGKIKAGELAWAITDPDGHDMWVDGPDDIKVFQDKDGVDVDYIPRSRTFIPAALKDNPFLIHTGYQATLDAMPEPLRSAIRDGNFMAAREDDAFQVIPTNWVLLANERWREREHKPKDAMSSIGLDVARGGRDQTVFSPRHNTFFDTQVCVPGRKTPDGTSVAVLAAGMLRHGAVIGIDNIGIGADAETALKNASLPFEAMNGSAASTGATRDGAFQFATFRSEMWWMFREALDPEYGYDLALPPDPALLADLTAPHWEPRPGNPPKIYVESKQDLLKPTRLGRSPDKGDSIVYAWNSGGMGQKTNSVSSGPTQHSPAPDMGGDPRRMS